VIHDVINGSNHIVEHVFVSISRSHVYYHKLTYHTKLSEVNIYFEALSDDMLSLSDGMLKMQRKQQKDTIG
jgi:hypothetical protein